MAVLRWSLRMWSARVGRIRNLCYPVGSERMLGDISVGQTPADDVNGTFSILDSYTACLNNLT